jgi:hypothetical protein
MKVTLKKRISLGAVSVAAVSTVVGACFVDTTLNCPTTVHGQGGICTLDPSGQTYQYVRNAKGTESGLTGAKSEDGPDCRYDCPDGAEWYYYGAYPSGDWCQATGS